MFQTIPLKTLSGDSQAAIAQTSESLRSVGLQVKRSFDLQIARAAHLDCVCPHHGTDQCDCQMVIMLVYGQEELPITLVLHGRDNQTQVALVETPDQPPAPQLLDVILQALILTSAKDRKPTGFFIEGNSHAA
jgi:hypothetical protein